MQLPLLSRRAACVAAVLLAAAGAGRAAPAPTSVIAEYETQTTLQGRVMKSTMKLWFKGDRRREEQGIARANVVRLYLPDGMYALMPFRKDAMKTPLTPQLKARLAHAWDVETIKKSSKKVGSEKVGRYQADIYEQTVPLNQQGMPSGKVTQRVSVAPGVPVPVKVVSSIPIASVMLLKTIQTNNKIRRRTSRVLKVK